MHYISNCDLILKEVQKVLDNLVKLETQHLFVSTQTRALHDACEQSLQDQVCFSFKVQEFVKPDTMIKHVSITERYTEGCGVRLFTTCD